LEGSTIGKEEKFDDLDKVFENPGVKTETTSETTDIEENTSDSDASEMETVNGNSSDSNIEPTQIETKGQESDSKFFAIRTTGGQEHIVVNLAQNRINSKKIAVRSILLLDSFKGYIIIEAPDSNIAYDALIGVRHVKGQIRG
jgi:transcriptional antiterminator NusG